MVRTAVRSVMKDPRPHRETAIIQVTRRRRMETDQVSALQVETMEMTTKRSLAMMMSVMKDPRPHRETASIHVTRRRRMETDQLSALKVEMREMTFKGSLEMMTQ